MARTRLRFAGLLLTALATWVQAQDDPAAGFLSDADLHDQADQRAASLAAVESAIRAEGRKGVEGLRRRAAWRLRDGDLEGALGDLDRALERAPRDATLLVQRSLVRGRLPGEAEAAVQDLDEALALEPQLIEALVERSRRWRASGDGELGDSYLGKAAGLTEEAEEARDHGVPVAWERARLSRLAGDVEGERDALARIRELWPLWTALPARYRLCLDLPPLAAWRVTLDARAAEVDELAELEEGHPRRRAWRGLALAEARDYVKAIPELEAALQGDPTLCEAGLMLAWLVERREPERAAKLLDRAVEAAPDARLRCAARVARAAARERANDRTGALADLDDALRHLADDRDALYARGRLRFDLGAWEKAEEDLTGAVKAAPGDAWAWYYRGQCRSRRYAFEGALADLDRALELSPRTAWLWIGRANVRVQCGLAGAAATDAARAIDLEPKRIEGWLVRVEALEALGDTSGALAAVTKALAIDERRADTWVARGRLRAAAGDAAGARADAAAAALRSVGEAEGCLNRARVLEALDDLDGAARDYRRTLELRPRGGWIVVALAMVEVARGETEAAHELVRRVPDELYAALLGAATGEPADRTRLAPLAASGRWPAPVAAHLLGELDEAGLLDAAEDLKLGAGLATQRCEARTYLGLVAERVGDLEAARAHYQAAVETSATQVLELALSRRRLAALKPK